MYFKKNAGDNELSFPITHAQLTKLSPCGLVSVRVGKSRGIPMPPALCNAAARKVALAEVMKVRELTKDGIFARWFMEKYFPEDWGTFPEEIPEPLALAHNVYALPAPLSYDDPAGLADVVRMDHPVDLGRVILAWLINEGYRPANSETGTFDFVDVAAHSMAEMATAVAEALDVAFDVKYFYGIQRPEELAGENMTAYEEGCPGHPTYPAGHGAAAAATLRYLAGNFKKYNPETRELEAMPDEVVKTIFVTCYVWAMARALAGVHFAVDNPVFFPRRHEFN